MADTLTLLPVAKRASPVNPNVTEYYNTDTGVGFKTPDELASFVNTKAPGAQATGQNVFSLVDPIISPFKPDTTIIPADKLNSDAYKKLSDVLGASVTPDMISPEIAGLLALNTASSEEQKKYDQLSSDLTTYLGKLGQQGADLQTALEDQGVNQSTAQLKELNLKVAQLQGELQKIDAETTTGLSDIENRPITHGSISAQQSQYSRERNLLRLSKAAELSATTALSQAYQGNIQIATEQAQRSVELKYQPIQSQIQVLQTQLGLAKDSLSSSESKRANIISALLTTRQKEVDAAKTKEKAIAELAVEAARNGAPLTLVQQMQRATDDVAAAQIGSAYLKDTLKSGTSTSGDITSPVPQGGTKFSNEDRQTLIAAGFSAGDIVQIQNDINKYGAEQVKQGLDKKQQAAIDKVLTGSQPATQKQFLTNEYVKGLFDDIDQAAKDAGFTKKGGGLFGTGWFARDHGDPDAFIKDLMTKVQQYRDEGFTDTEIKNIIKKS